MPSGPGARLGALAVATCPIPRELVGDAAAARAALDRPLKGFFLFLQLFLFARGAAEVREPLAHDIEVFVLVEGVEGDPQPEALRERDLLLHRFAGMDLFADVAR